jgi:hypothetical protein
MRRREPGCNPISILLQSGGLYMENLDTLRIL